jgi:hypothetical protein
MHRTDSDRPGSGLAALEMFGAAGQFTAQGTESAVIFVRQ